MSSDDEVLARLRGVAFATKRIGVQASWQAIPHKSTQALRLVAALEIDGVVVEGLYLHGRTLKYPAEQDLTFQLEYRWGGVSHQLCRLDWCPKKPHTDNAGPLASRKSFEGSQWHSFESNAQLGLYALRPGPHGNPAATKFRDISDLAEAPRRVAVLSDRPGTDPADINLLSRSAHIIEFAARDEIYRRAA